MNPEIAVLPLLSKSATVRAPSRELVSEKNSVEWCEDNVDDEKGYLL